MKIYIVRHGQTDGNVQLLMDGNKRDIPLNDVGKEQAKEIKNELKEIDFDYIYSSPLIRAKETADIITDNNTNIIIDKRIEERDSGELTGLPTSSFDRNAYWNYNDTTVYESVENIKDVFKRVYSFIDELKEKYIDENILVVTHSGITRVINCYFNGIPEDGDLLKCGTKNCEVKIYEINKESN